jgi:hypothetical protein
LIRETWRFISTKASSSDISFEPYALKLKIQKCKLYSTGPRELFDSEVFAEIPVEVERISSQTGGIKFLGSPVGNLLFCRSFCINKALEYKKRIEAICVMKDKQSALLLLRYCHVTRFSFLLRTTAPHVIDEAAKIMDDNTRFALCHILELVEIYMLPRLSY